jgi:hypothetical protein
MGFDLSDDEPQSATLFLKQSVSTFLCATLEAAIIKPGEGEGPVDPALNDLRQLYITRLAGG